MRIPLSVLTKLDKEGLATVQVINRIENSPKLKTVEEKAVKVLLSALKDASQDYETVVLKQVA